MHSLIFEFRKNWNFFNYSQSDRHFGVEFCSLNLQFMSTNFIDFSAFCASGIAEIASAARAADYSPEVTFKKAVKGNIIDQNGF